MTEKQTRADMFYECMENSYDVAVEFARRASQRMADMVAANNRRQHPARGTDLDVIIFGDPTFKSHRGDEVHNRAWALTYAQLYVAARMRQIELNNRTVETE